MEPNTPVEGEAGEFNQMDVEIIGKDGQSLSFVLEDVDVSIANGLRRTMMSGVPTLVIEDVHFYENSSSLYDEIIAHRLGLVPIKTDLELFNFRDACSCEDGCPSCTLTLSLKKEGPRMVYSNDLKSEDRKIKPVKGIPLIKLGKNQKVELEAVAILGTAKEHAKWQPGVVSYKYHPQIKVTDKCDVCERCVEACPRKILTLRRGKIKVTNERECILCNCCVDVCEVKAITVKGDDRRFIFKVEGNGSLEPEEIFTRACEILKEKSEELMPLL